MSAAQVDADVQALLKEHTHLLVVEVGEGDNKRVRIRCDLTQHEMLPRKEAIETYLKGKKFQKAKEWYCYDYTQYEPYIVPHRRKDKCLFCNVTDTVLNRIPAEVEKHVNGKKFQRLKEHVKFSTREEKDSDPMEFNANEFEFENKQILYSDDEDGDGASRQPKKKSSDDEDDEAEGDDEEDDEAKADEDEDAMEDGDDDDDEEEEGGSEDEEDDMAEFYPQDDDEEPEDEHIREAVKRLTMKKRKASTDDADESTSKQTATSKASKAKKQKASKK